MSLRVSSLGSVLAILITLVAGTAAAAQKTDWTTFGFDNARHGYNPYETILSPATVGNLKLKWGVQMGGPIYSQPLVATNVLVGNSYLDLVYSTDGAGNIAAIDAASGTVIWSRSAPPVQGGATCGDFPGNLIGIPSTPVLDRAHHRIFLVAPNATIYALDEATGAPIPGWEVGVSLTQTPGYELVYSALSLQGGKLFAEIAGYCDAPPYRGRIVEIDIANVAIAGIWNVVGVASQQGGGIWGMGGIAIDETQGAIYTATGNGLPDETSGYSDSVVRLNFSLNVAGVDQPNIWGDDTDFGSTPVLFDAPGCPGQLVVLSKAGYLLTYNRDSLWQGIRQGAQTGNNIGNAAYDPKLNIVYIPNSIPSNDKHYAAGILAFPVGTDCNLHEPVQITAGFSPQPYLPIAPPSLANGVLYASNATGGTFSAFDAATGNLLAMTPQGFVTGGIAASPSVANGQVYVGGLNGMLYAFGL